jgi:hypothetical protein
MPSAFGKFLDAVADALGLSSENSRRRQQPARPGPPRTTETGPPAQPKSDGGPGLFSAAGFPVTADDCRVCGVRPAKPEHYNQFCSDECERDMGDRMDAWHDQFEEHFGEGDTYEEWRAQIEAEHGKDYLADIDKRAREKD